VVGDVRQVVEDLLTRPIDQDVRGHGVHSAPQNSG
jgi:hypothetical protein